MTPEQLERIKRELTAYLFDRGHRITKPLIEDIVHYILSSKSLNLPDQDEEELQRQKREHKWSMLTDEEKLTIAKALKHSVATNHKPVITEHKPIQLKNLKDPE